MTPQNNGLAQPVAEGLTPEAASKKKAEGKVSKGPGKARKALGTKLGAQVWASLSPADKALLNRLQAAAPNAELALVGGAVRDALLGQATRSPDLDVVLQGSGGGHGIGELARAYSEACGQPHTFHPEFENATLTLPDGRSLDLIRARRERYPVAGQRPKVERGTLTEDLQRRDFGLNALALRLREQDVLGAPGGLRDLKARVLRPLHPRSLHEDASRLVRGARLAGRLGLTAHAELLRQVPGALQMAPCTPRLWAELGLLLAEPSPAAAAAKLRGWGAGELLPAGVPEWWQKLEGSGPATPDLYAAALLHAAETSSHALTPAEWGQRLGLSSAPARLLARALSHGTYPPGSPELRLRQVLVPERPSYTPLQGRDLLAAGWAAGPALGRALAHLRALRAAGQVQAREDEWAALRVWEKAQSLAP